MPARQTRYHSTAEVAAEFGVTTYSVRRWIRAGELRAFRLSANRPTGDDYAISPQALAAFKRKRQTRKAMA